MKKATAITITLLILLQTTILVSAKSGQTIAEAYWPSFRGEETLKGITDAKTPVTTQATSLLWQVKLGTGWFSNMGNPIEVGQYIYVPVSGSIMKLDKSTGEVAAQGTLSASIGYFSTIAYGEGKIFVPIAGGRVQAFDAGTLTSLWITEAPTDEDGNTMSSLQSLSPITYHNGYIYMGASSSNASRGIFFCASTVDEDPSQTDEIKNFTWSYVPSYDESELKNGFYWSEGTVVGNAIVFAGEAGELFSHHLTQDRVIDRLILEQSGTELEAIRSSVHYDYDNQRIYAATKAGNIHSITLNADGTFDRGTYLRKLIASDITSSPVTYNGRLYIAGGGISSNAPFSVLNADTLETIYTIDGIQSQSSPILTTAYASGENKQEVYLYALKYTSPDTLYCIRDYEGNASPDYVELKASPQPEYNMSSVTVGIDGTLYYKNDSGYLFAYGNTNSAFTAGDVENAINNLPSLDRIKSTDETLIERVEYRYGSLSGEEQAAVSNSDVLASARARLEELQNLPYIISKLIADIDALPNTDAIALEHRSTVLSLWQTYQSIPDENKAEVTNAQKLMDAKAKVDSLSASQSVQDIIDKIDALPNTVTMAAKAQINTVYAQYDALDTALQAQVTNSGKLLNLKADLDALEKEIEWINNAIWSLDPENITLDDKALIDEILARYEALSDEDKAYVLYYDEVLEFKAIVDELEKEQEGKPQDGDEDDQQEDNSLLGKMLNPKTGDLSAGMYFVFTTLCGCLLWMIFQKYASACHKL